MKKALVLSLALVLGLGVASIGQTLSGLWNTTVIIDPTPITLSITSELKVTYSVSGWAFTSDTLLDATGWYLQKFDATGALGAFTLGSDLVFNPQTPAMVQWVVDGGISLAGVTFDLKFVSVPTDTAFVIGASGSAGNVDVSVDVTLGSAWYDADALQSPYGANYGKSFWYAAQTNSDGCGFDFGSIVIDVSFPFCCANVDAGLVFSCLGFQYATFGVTDIMVPNLPWFSLDATVKFTMDAKTLILSPNFDFGAFTCFNLYIGQYTNSNYTDPYLPGYGTVVEPGTGPFLLQDIHIDGISLSCDIGGVKFLGVSYWGPASSNDATYGYPYDLKPSILNGTKYWEAYQIKTTDDGCCGPFAFDVTVYFLNGGAKLFDLGEIRANMSIQIATQFTFSTGIRYDLNASDFTRWSIGLKVVW